MKRGILWLLLGIISLPIPAAQAAFDGSQPLICAIRSVVECAEVKGCEKGSPESVNAPTFMRFDFQAMSIRGTRADQSERTSKIERTTHLDGKLLLQGADDGIEDVRDGLAWSIAIREDTGEMVVSAVGDNVAFVAFGACTSL